MITYLLSHIPSPVGRPGLHENPEISKPAVDAKTLKIGSGYRAVMANHPYSSGPPDAVQKFSSAMRLHEWLSDD